MEEKLISIIIPVYKVEQYIKRCIDNVINQTYKNLEIILVDDGSPDKCPQICDEYAKIDKRIKVIHKENGGLVSAWTTGVKKSTGEFIAFIDSDDWPELDYIETMAKAMFENNVDLVITAYYDSYDNKRKYAKSILEKHIKDKIYTGEELKIFKERTLNQLHYFCKLYRWNKLFKREMVMKNFYLNNLKISLFEDTFISLSCILDSNSIYYVSKPVYNYYQRKTSMLHTFDERAIDLFLEYDNSLKFLLNEKKIDNEYCIVRDRVRYLIFLNQKLFDSSNENKKKYFYDICNIKLVEESFKSPSYKNLSILRKIFLKNIYKKRYFIVKYLTKAKKIYVVFRDLIKGKV